MEPNTAQASFLACQEASLVVENTVRPHLRILPIDRANQLRKAKLAHPLSDLEDVLPAPSA